MTNIERTPDQNPIDQIAANDVNFTETDKEMDMVIKERPDEISEKEKQEYRRLNKKYKELVQQVWEYSLSKSDREYFEKNGMPYVRRHYELVSGWERQYWLFIYSKSNKYHGVRFRHYHEDWYWSSRPRFYDASDSQFFWNHGSLDVDQYKKMLDKVEEIVTKQVNYLQDKEKKSNDKKDEEIDDMINNL